MPIFSKESMSYTPCSLISLKENEKLRRYNEFELINPAEQLAVFLSSQGYLTKAVNDGHGLNIDFSPSSYSSNGFGRKRAGVVLEGVT